MTWPTKTVRMGGRTYQISGLSETDPYFVSIEDQFEERFLSFCREHLADDAVCLDIGANIGLTAICLSQTVDRGIVVAVEAAPERGIVVAVEAAPEVVELLALNVESNKLRNVRVVHSAVGAKDGEVRFLSYSAYGHIEEDSGTTVVPLRRLASVLEDEGLDRLDFVKIDVEGYEFHILQDAFKLIDYHRAVVLFEFNVWCQLAYSRLNPRDVILWLFDHFSYVARLTADGAGRTVLERIDRADAIDLLHRILVVDHCCADLVVTNHPERLDPSVRLLRNRLDAALRERDTALRERDTALRERNTALAELAAHRSSRSWRLTAPLRDLSGLVRRHSI
jgi:FkbM family methyltransferase